MFELSVQTVGKIDIWIADFTDMQKTNSLLQRDIDQLLARDQNHNAYGVQTATSLHKLAGVHWQRFFELLRAFVSQIFEEHSIQHDEGKVSLRAWASKITCRELHKKETLHRSFHDHTHAALSLVYYLQIQSASDEAPGTIFLNPLPSGFTSASPGILVQAHESRVVAFPGWLTHSVDILSEFDAEMERIVIGVDVYFTPN